MKTVKTAFVGGQDEGGLEMEVGNLAIESNGYLGLW